MNYSKLISATFLLLLLTENRIAAQQMVSINGTAQGTTYHIKYFDVQNRNLKTHIDSILTEFDKSLSLYREDSELSLFNRSHAIRLTTPYFYPVLVKSKEVYEATEGMFDPTILPLTEAYGFGAKKTNPISDIATDSILSLIGFGQIQFDSIMVSKNKEHVRLDFNGIAQGYSVDVISRFLEEKNINRYMVEIGGEIFCKGSKNEGSPWISGIENPLKPGSLVTKVTLQNRAMTTAGNYRNHFKKDGLVFNHLINPKTGSMEQTSLLSVTVFAPDAVSADAYDTAFFVMGIEKTKAFLKTRKDLDVFLVYQNASGKLITYASDGIKDFIQSVSN
ncbi:FAD:protein FMN transferase [Dyadobacter luteus]|nr:FAD:protein FMN transferase [Dyadobacter luteus]